MTSQPLEDNLLLDILESDPAGQRALFESFIPPGFGQQQQRQLGTLFQPTFNRFLGQIGSQVREGGGVPDLTFTQFLEQNFDPQRQLLQQRQQRGPAQSATRFNFVR